MCHCIDFILLCSLVLINGLWVLLGEKGSLAVRFHFLWKFGGVRMLAFCLLLIGVHEMQTSCILLANSTVTLFNTAASNPEHFQAHWAHSWVTEEWFFFLSCLVKYTNNQQEIFSFGLWCENCTKSVFLCVCNMQDNIAQMSGSTWITTQNVNKRAEPAC